MTQLIKVEILDCGHRLFIESENTNGPALTEERKRICYDCATLREKAEMILGDTHIGYLSCAGHEIQTWAGGTLVKVTQLWQAPHNWAGKMYHWRGEDSQGRFWYGKCVGKGMVTVMHKVKDRRVIESGEYRD